MNRLYVVRPGDDIDSIAQKIYGDSSRSEDLYSYNPHFRGKSVKVGDKIYYESPVNPTDQRMITFYEDNNVTPQYYTSDEGDNIRKVSESLLGHERSWMEIWATNEDVQSKWTLPAGVRLRYWPEGASVPTTVAMNEPVNNSPVEMDEPAPAPMPEPTTEPEPMPSDEPPAPSDMAMNEPDMPDLNNDDMGMDESDEIAKLDDPQAFDDGSGAEDFDPPPVAGSTGTPPPPKPVAPPPPPPPAPKADFNKPAPPKNVDINPPGSSDDPLAAFSDDSTIMAGIGALLILAAVIVLIFIRRNRAKRVNFSQTQV